MFGAGEEVLDIGCKSEILRKETIGIGLKSLGLVWQWGDMVTQGRGLSGAEKRELAGLKSVNVLKS